jgi:hypothetical protein
MTTIREISNIALPAFNSQGGEIIDQILSACKQLDVIACDDLVDDILEDMSTLENEILAEEAEEMAMGDMYRGDYADDGRWDDDPSPYDGTYSEM